MLVKLKSKHYKNSIWYEPENEQLVEGEKIYNSCHGYCYYHKNDFEIIDTKPDYSFEDFYKVEALEDDLDFSFMFNKTYELGTHFMDNRFLSEADPSLQLTALLEEVQDYSNYTPEGVYFSDEMDKIYGDQVYKPLILSDENGDRIYVHINYNKWLKWAEVKSLQKSE